MLEIKDRVSVFKTSVNVLTPHVKNAFVDIETPDLNPEFYSDPLFVQLSALCLLRGGDIPTNDVGLLETTLDHEAKYWLADGLKREQVESVLAVITLWQGLSEGEVNKIVKNWPDKDSMVTDVNSVVLSERLRTLYPGEDGKKWGQTLRAPHKNSIENDEL
jgi:hypothetical protein